LYGYGTSGTQKQRLAIGRVPVAGKIAHLRNTGTLGSGNRAGLLRLRVPLQPCELYLTAFDAGGTGGTGIRACVVSVPAHRHECLYH
jgi:hypothetical protein